MQPTLPLNFDLSYQGGTRSGISVLDGVQMGLDAAGLIPGFGEPIDAINGAIYFMRGDKVNAGLSVVSVIPFFGMAGTAGKLGNKGLKVNQDYKNALKQYKNTNLSNVGRALTKHPEVIGHTHDTLRMRLRTDMQINKTASMELKNIMRNGTQSSSTHKVYGKITTYQIKDGFGARFYDTNEFIGFINP